MIAAEIFIEWFKRVILGRINKYGMTNSETKLYFKILKSLSKDSFINTKEITHFLAQYLSNQKFEVMADITKYDKNIIDFANRIQDAKHIIYTPTKTREKRDSEGVMHSKLQIFASLTPEGLVFLNNYLDRKTNKRIVWFQIFLAVLTTFFIAVTAFYQFKTYDYGAKKDEAKQPKLYQVKLQKLKTNQKQQTKTLPYPIAQIPQNPQKNR